MEGNFDLIEWNQKQLAKIRAQVRVYQDFRDSLQIVVNASEWKKPGMNGKIYTESAIPLQLAISAMSSIEISIHWINEIILHLNRQDAELVQDQAALIEAKAKKEATQ